MLSPELVVPRSDAMPVTTVRHGGVELPLFDGEDVTWSTQELQHAVRIGRPNIVRSIRLNPTIRFELAELLDITEQTFAEVAEQTDSTVIDHTWGLAVPPARVSRDDRVRYLSFFSQDLPAETALVAQVDIIQGARPVYDRFHELNSALLRHLSGLFSQYVWFDAYPRNFVQDQQGKLYLSDIEPFIIPAKDRKRPSGEIVHLTDSTAH